MREILFRGKRTNNGEWICGSLCATIPSDEDFYTISYFDFEGYYIEEKVIPETVGQFTGLTDKNGKKIFEGDIVKHFNVFDVGVDIGKVCWDDKYCQFYRTSNSGMHNYRVGADCSYEVVGNIHDNPELLKGCEG